MPRKRNLDPNVPTMLKLPQSLRTKVDLYLFSELEGRVPQGKYKEFFSDRIREFFSWRRLDLQPYGFPVGCFVAGPKDIVEALQRKLAEKDL